MQRKFWKRPFHFGPYETNFRRYSWLDLYQQVICLRRQHCCNASHWVGLLRFLVFSYQLMSVSNATHLLKINKILAHFCLKII